MHNLEAKVSLAAACGIYLACMLPIDLTGRTAPDPMIFVGLFFGSCLLVRGMALLRL